MSTRYVFVCVAAVITLGAAKGGLEEDLVVAQVGLLHSLCIVHIVGIIGALKVQLQRPVAVASRARVAASVAQAHAGSGVVLVCSE